MSNQTSEELTKQRRRQKRVARMKSMIIGTVFGSILILLICCIVFGVRIHMLQKQIDELIQVVAMKQESEKVVNQTAMTGGKPDNSGDATQSSNIAEKNTQKAETTESTKKAEDTEDTGNHSGEYGINYHQNIYLTFDDGPSENTDEILDILKEYNVKATFFVIGKEDKESARLYKRIVDEGHTLALHSYTHKYSSLYASLDSFVDEVTKEQKLIYTTTGFMPKYFRFPGGSSNQVCKTDMKELIRYLNNAGMKYFDWNISCGDATNQPYTSQDLIQNVMNDISKYHTAVILMHDANNKDATVEALPKLLKQLQKRDADILPISDDTPLVQHIKYDSVED